MGTHVIHQNVLNVDESGNPVSASGGGLTDTELRATPVPVSVSGSLTLGSAVEITNDVGNPIPVVDTATESALGAPADAESTSGNGSVIAILKNLRTRIASVVTLLAGGLPAALGAGGGLKVDGSGTALPVSGTVTANAGTGTLAVSGPVTDTQLRATAVPVSGTVAATQSGTFTVQPGNTANTTAWKTDGSAVTQPVSASALPLPTGAATAAKQPALGTAGSAATDVITVQGVASMTPLKVDGSAAAVGGFTVNSTATITRPGDTTAYAAKDAISSSTSAPAILTFTSCARASGGAGYVTSARVVTNQAACVSAFRLHLYDATLSAVNDNAAQTNLETNWGSSIGYIDFPAMTSDGSDTAASQTTDKPLPFVAAGTSLFGMLETITGFTPANAQHFQIKLGIEQN